MSPQADQRSRYIALGVVVFAVLGAAIGAGITWHQAPNQLDTYLIQLFATLIGALLAVSIGLALFDYQSRETDRRRSRQLKEAFIGELQATIDILEAPFYETIAPPEGSKEEEPVEVILTHLEPVICEETMRNAITGPWDTFALSHLARQMRHYNFAAKRLEEFLWGTSVTHKQKRDFKAAQFVKHSQDSVISWCRTNIEGLSAEENIDPPPRHYSKEPREDPGD